MGKNTPRCLKLRVEGAWKQELVRENGIFIIDKIAMKIKSASIIHRLNDVRFYLKVSRMSDIVTEDGSSIYTWTLFGSPSESDLK